MSENNNPQPKTKKQPPNTIGKPPKTEFINSNQQSTRSELSDK